MAVTISSYSIIITNMKQILFKKNVCIKKILEWKMRFICQFVNLCVGRTQNFNFLSKQKNMLEKISKKQTANGSQNLIDWKWNFNFHYLFSFKLANRITAPCLLQLGQIARIGVEFLQCSIESNLKKSRKNWE